VGRFLRHSVDAIAKRRSPCIFNHFYVPRPTWYFNFEKNLLLRWMLSVGTQRFKNIVN